MAVIVSNGAGNLSDVNRFYRSDSYNVGMYSSYANSIATPKSQIITYSNTGKCKGVIVGIRSFYSTLGSISDKVVQLDLEQYIGNPTMAVASPGVVTMSSHGLIEGQGIRFSTTGALLTGITAGTIYYVRYINANTFNISSTPTGTLINFSGTQSGTHSLWAIRDSKSLTSAELNYELNAPSPNGDVWDALISFEFSDGGYTIDTVSNGWRITLFTLSGTKGTYHWINSDYETGVAMNYITWSDNQVTAVSGSDAIYCKDIINIDCSFDFKPYLGTGSTLYGWCGGVTNSNNTTKEGRCNLICDNPSASYTIGIDGMFVISARGGIRFGSVTTRIPFINQLTVNFKSPSVGTSVQSALFTPYRATSSTFKGKSTFLAYGEIPTKPYAILAQDAVVGATSIVTTEDLSAYWKTDDYICIGKLNTNLAVTTTLVWIQIASISGTTINLKSAIASYDRKSGGTIINRNAGYGINITIPYANYSSIQLGLADHLEISGVLAYQLNINLVNTLAYSNYGSQSSYRSKWNISDNCFYSASTSYYLLLATALIISADGFDIKRNYGVRISPIYAVNAYYGSRYKSGTLTYSDNRILGHYSGGLSGTTGAKLSIENNVFENNGASTYSVIVAHGINSTIKNNHFWGIIVASTAGAMQIGGGVDNLIESNYFDNCISAIGIGAFTSINFSIKNNHFGAETINITDLVFLAGGGYVQGTMINPLGTLVIDTNYQTELASGSTFGITNLNEVLNEDIVYLSNGYLKRCGNGLADTTKLGTNLFSLRFEPIDIANILKWDQDIPTGNIQNKTMVVMCKVKINSADYYGGSSYQLPRLTVNYDDGTLAYAVASNSIAEQTLVVPFSPITTYGKITVTVEGYTDATGSDAYFYVGDGQVLYPAGHQVNTGDFSLWANALPVVPWIATNLQAADVWAYLTSSITTVGSIGEFIKALPSAITITDAVWDEPLTGATHNVPTSAGRRLRQLGGNVILDGIAAGAGANGNQIILAADASAVNGSYDPSTIAIVLGTGAGQCRNILQYDGTTRTATVDRDWKVLPDITSEYVIYANAGREHVNEGLLQGAGASTAILNANASPYDDAYINQTLFLRSGLGEDQSRIVIDYNGTTKEATVDRPWDQIPDSTTGYAMLPLLATSAQLETNLETAMLKIDEIWNNAGLDNTDPLTITPSSRTTTKVRLALEGDGETLTKVTRE